MDKLVYKTSIIIPLLTSKFTHTHAMNMLECEHHFMLDTKCSGFNDNGSHRLKYLDAWSLGRIRSGLVREGLC